MSFSNVKQLRSPFRTLLGGVATGGRVTESERRPESERSARVEDFRAVWHMIGEWSGIDAASEMRLIATRLCMRSLKITWADELPIGCDFAIAHKNGQCNFGWRHVGVGGKITPV
jgi:hypothetical protein